MPPPKRSSTAAQGKRKKDDKDDGREDDHDAPAAHSKRHKGPTVDVSEAATEGDRRSTRASRSSAPTTPAAVTIGRSPDDLELASLDTESTRGKNVGGELTGEGTGDTGDPAEAKQQPLELLLQRTLDDHQDSIRALQGKLQTQEQEISFLQQGRSLLDYVGKYSDVEDFDGSASKSNVRDGNQLESTAVQSGTNVESLSRVSGTATSVIEKATSTSSMLDTNSATNKANPTRATRDSTQAQSAASIAAASGPPIKGSPRGPLDSKMMLNKQEAEILKKAEEMAAKENEKGAWNIKRWPKVQEPARNKSHWDYLLEEMEWLSKDFREERKWKMALAKKTAKLVLKWHEERRRADQKKNQADNHSDRKVAATIAGHVLHFWKQIERVVVYKHDTKIEMKKMEARNKHLDFLVGQTERYTNVLMHTMQDDDKVEDVDDSSSVSDIDERTRESYKKTTADLEKEADMSLEELYKDIPMDEQSEEEEESEGEDENEEGEEANTHEDKEQALQSSTEEEKDAAAQGEQLPQSKKLPQQGATTPKQPPLVEVTTDVSFQVEVKNQNDETDTKEAIGATNMLAQKNVEPSFTEAPPIATSRPLEEATSTCATSAREGLKPSEDGAETQHDPKLAEQASLLDEDEDDEKGIREMEGKSSTEKMETAIAQANEAMPTGSTLDSTQTKVKVPFLLRATLREYQHVALDWMVSMYEKCFNGILADEMGLGKTVMTISLLTWLAVEKGIWGPHLIVVPTSVMLNWEMELKRFAPCFKILTYYGSLKERKLKRQGWTKTNSFHICITSYKLVIQDQSAFRRKKWKYFILDEAHNIKNFKSQRWQTLLNFQSKRRLLLTGTPLQNNLMELWSLLHFLMPHIFESHKEFKDWFSNPLTGMIEGTEDVNSYVIDRLHAVLRPFLLRRLKKDVEKQIPPKYEHIVPCVLSKRQRNLYEDFMANTETRATLGSGNFLGMLNILMNLRKVCNHPDLFEERPIRSPHDMSTIHMDVPPLVLELLQPQVLDKNVTLDLFNMNMSAFEGLETYNAEQTRNLCTPKQVIMEMPDCEQVVSSQIQGPGILQQVWLGIQQQRHASRAKLTEHISYINEARCARHPLYGHNLRRSCFVTITSFHLANTVSNPTSPRAREMPAAIFELVQSHDTRMATCRSIIENFVSLIPKARAHRPILTTRPSVTSKLAAIDLEFKKELSPYLETYQPQIVRQTLFFPDKRLIQWDCGKLQALDVLLRELKAGGHRALIFTQMTRQLDILETWINICGYNYLRLDGATKVEDRQKLMDRYNSSDKIFLFILSTRSGGLGINLIGADTVIFYDSDWNPAMDLQAQDRAHRIGQTREVHIYRLVSVSTVEENILKKSQQKRLLDDVVIQGGGFTTDFFKNVKISDLFEDDTTGKEEPSRLPISTTKPIGTKEQASSGEKEGAEDDEMAKALLEAEDDADKEAMQKQKQEEEEANNEFDENVPFEGEGEEGVLKLGPPPEDSSGSIAPLEAGKEAFADDEMLSDVQKIIDTNNDDVQSQLSPIQRYAFRFLEQVLNVIDTSKVEQALDFTEQEWQIEHMQKMKEMEEARNDEEDEMLFYEVAGGADEYEASVPVQQYLMQQQQQQAGLQVTDDLKELELELWGPPQVPESEWDEDVFPLENEEDPGTIALQFPEALHASKMAKKKRAERKKQLLADVPLHEGRPERAAGIRSKQLLREIRRKSSELARAAKMARKQKREEEDEDEDEEEEDEEEEEEEMRGVGRGRGGRMGRLKRKGSDLEMGIKGRKRGISQSFDDDGEMAMDEDEFGEGVDQIEDGLRKGLFAKGQLGKEGMMGRSMKRHRGRGGSVRTDMDSMRKGSSGLDGAMLAGKGGPKAGEGLFGAGTNKGRGGRMGRLVPRGGNQPRPKKLPNGEDAGAEKQVVWTKEDDSVLRSLVHEFGTNWELLCDLLNSQLPQRYHSSKQCCDRWSHVLHPREEGGLQDEVEPGNEDDDKYKMSLKRGGQRGTAQQEKSFLCPEENICIDTLDPAPTIPMAMQSAEDERRSHILSARGGTAASRLQELSLHTKQFKVMAQLFNNLTKSMSSSLAAVSSAAETAIVGSIPTTPSNKDRCHPSHLSAAIAVGADPNKCPTPQQVSDMKAKQSAHMVSDAEKQAQALKYPQKPEASKLLSQSTEAFLKMQGSNASRGLNSTKAKGKQSFTQQQMVANQQILMPGGSLIKGGNKMGDNTPSKAGTPQSTSNVQQLQQIRAAANASQVSQSQGLHVNIPSSAVAAGSNTEPASPGSKKNPSAGNRRASKGALPDKSPKPGARGGKKGKSSPSLLPTSAPQMMPQQQLAFNANQAVPTSAQQPMPSSLHQATNATKGTASGVVQLAGGMQHAAHHAAASSIQHAGGQGAMLQPVMGNLSQGKAVQVTTSAIPGTAVAACLNAQMSNTPLVPPSGSASAMLSQHQSTHATQPALGQQQVVSAAPTSQIPLAQTQTAQSQSQLLGPQVASTLQPIATTASQNSQASASNVKGLPMAVLLQVISQRPQLKTKIQEIVGRKDFSEPQKMNAIQQIIRENNPSGGESSSTQP